ncbi:MAG: ATP synthase F1 subunit delta [bacterium]|nr:ATP synthase F1 subunit delta [bacterium]
MGQSVVCKRYAKALVDLAVQEGLLDQIQQNLGRTVTTIVNNRELKNLFFNPVFKAEDKRRALDLVIEDMEISGLLKKFLLHLLEQDRFPLIEGIYASYGAFADKLNNRVEAEVLSAFPLAEEDRSRLKARLEKMTGKTIYLKVKEDPSLIGGIITKLGSVVYDGSVKSHMLKLKDQIIKG